MTPPGVVFLGPSLPGPRPPFPGVEVRPPAVRGDLHRAADEGARVIGLVDGRFYQAPAVTPAEVREVAARGVRLVGGGSLGAVRAVECPTAMEGVGTVWAGFRAGRLRAEDEIAAAYDPDTDRTLAWPLVTLRAALRAAVHRGHLSPAEARRALAGLRALPFDARDRRAVAERLPAPGRAEVLADLAAGASDPKRRDALEVLARVCALASALATAPIAR